VLERYCARVGEPVLDRHVDVAQLWRLACDAARQGEKWGQRKKSVSDAMERCYTELRRDKRGAKQWVAQVVDVLGFFDPSADWRAVEVGLQMLDQVDGDAPASVLNCSDSRSCRPPRRRTLCSRACSAASPPERPEAQHPARRLSAPPPLAPAPADAFYKSSIRVARPSARRWAYEAATVRPQVAAVRAEAPAGARWRSVGQCSSARSGVGELLENVVTSRCGRCRLQRRNRKGRSRRA
jgi:hypothetical protein